MSTVHVKDRKETQLLFVTQAQELQVRVIKYSMNEKRIPKAWRFMVSHDLIQKTYEFMDDIIAAEQTFPTDKESANLRIEYLKKSLTELKQIEQRLLSFTKLIDTVRFDSLGAISELIVKEISSLKSMQERTKVLRDKF